MALDYLVAGLGNPGSRYTRTRHNLGFELVEAIASARGARWGAVARGARTARCRLAGNEILLVEPLTYMNLSGDPLSVIVAAESLPHERVLVVCDDIALPLGSVRLRKSGSDGGHNGLKSVIARLGGTGFPRLRLGVGPVPERVDSADFVLAEFLPEEETAVADMLKAAAAAVDAWIVHGIDKAMSISNIRVREPGESPPNP